MLQAARRAGQPQGPRPPGQRVPAHLQPGLEGGSLGLGRGAVVPQDLQLRQQPGPPALEHLQPGVQALWGGPARRGGGGGRRKPLAGGAAGGPHWHEHVHAGRWALRSCLERPPSRPSRPQRRIQAVRRCAASHNVGQQPPHQPTRPGPHDTRPPSGPPACAAWTWRRPGGWPGCAWRAVARRTGPAAGRGRAAWRKGRGSTGEQGVRQGAAARDWRGVGSSCWEGLEAALNKRGQGPAV